MHHSHLTPGNVDDRKPVRQMVHRLKGLLFGDKGYIAETPRVKTRGISRYKLRLPYVLHNVSYSPKT